MTKLTCAHCSSSIDVGSFDKEHRETVTKKFSEPFRLKLFTFVREYLDISLGEVKVLYHHFSRWGGHCHRCRQSLQERGLVVCAACGVLNVDWFKEITAPPPFENTQALNPLFIIDCPQCGHELGHGVTRCHRRACSYVLPQGFYASKKQDEEGVSYG